MSKARQLMQAAGTSKQLSEMFSILDTVVTDHQKQDLINRFVTFFEELYTEEEMDELIAVYEIPVMRKHLDSGNFTNAAMKLGEEWAKDNNL